MTPTRTLIRGLTILEALADAGTPLGPTGLAETVGLDKATAGRLLYTLGVAGYVRQDEQGRYALTSKLLQLTQHLSLEPELTAVARPHLMELRNATGETTHLGVLDGDQVVYIDKIEGRHSVRLVSAVGQSMPLHTTALGKAALAWMRDDERELRLARLSLAPRTPQSLTTAATLHDDLLRTRARGYSLDDRENEDQASCVGAAIMGRDRTPVAMLSVSGPTARVMAQLDSIGRHCAETAAVISKELTGEVTGTA